MKPLKNTATIQNFRHLLLCLFAWLVGWTWHLYYSAAAYIFADPTEGSKHEEIVSFDWLKWFRFEIQCCSFADIISNKMDFLKITVELYIQIISLGLPKRGSHPLRGGSKLEWHVSGSSFGMNSRPSAIAH